MGSCKEWDSETNDMFMNEDQEIIYDEISYQISHHI